MSKINGEVINDEDFKFRLDAIESAIKIASDYNGEVFGGFVRDVLMLRRIDPKCNVSFKDVDIWFRTRFEAALFIANIKKVGEIFENGHPGYDFDSKQYNFVVKGKFVAWVDIVVSDVFPVNDFDVNYLKCHYTNNNIVQHILVHPSSPSNYYDIKTNILNQDMNMSESYAKKLSTDGNQKHLDRVRHNYIEKGWIIKYKNSKLVKNDFNDRKSFVNALDRISNEKITEVKKSYNENVCEAFESSNDKKSYNENVCDASNEVVKPNHFKDVCPTGDSQYSMNEKNKTEVLNKYLQDLKLAKEANINKNKSYDECVKYFTSFELTILCELNKL